MSQLGPEALLLWAILATLQFVFLLYHLYQFDRFQCLRWSPERSQGTFKRMLTYVYLLGVPMMLGFAVSLAYLKYHYGYVQILDGYVIPAPTPSWSPRSQAIARILYIVFSVIWSLEIVGHLEELNFWLFLLCSNANARPWLESPFFIIWCAGSALAMVGLPVVAAFAGDADRTEAFVLIVGSAGSGIITVVSLRVSWLFPRFLRRIKSEGAEIEVIGRLAKYAELNNIRLLFRFLFVIPLMILGIEGLVNRDHTVPLRFWKDLLAMLAGIGVVVSSAITLLVFFPRASLVEELEEDDEDEPAIQRKTATASAHDTLTNTLSYHQNRPSHYHSRSQSTSNTLLNCTNGLGLSLGPTLAYPPPIFSSSKSGQIELDDVLMQTIRDSWAKSPDPIEYDVTVERYDDVGRRIPARRSRSRSMAKAIDDLPFETTKIAGARYSVEVRRRRSDHDPVDGFTGMGV